MSRLTSESQLLQLLGRRVHKRRVELGMSQEELAEKAKLHRTYISDVERGIRNISILTLARISNALDISAAVLLF